uniref:Translocon-associated protein subunit beta n=1 Tax=Eurycantha calcarata TaxID=93610 RepID=A0A481SWA2_9NEOP|nr:translocon-associated protein, beta subunit precursor [Eurycantha calcarata]
MKTNIFVIFLGVLVAVGCNEDEDSSARLLISKQILNRFLVEDMDIIVKYTIYNVGSSAALNVQLTDSSFSPESFDVVGGQLSMRLDRVAPGINVSHVVVVRPKRSGFFNFTAADVTYKATEDATEFQEAVTSEPGEGGIVPFRDYDKKYSPHVLDWATFAVMTLPSLLIPFLLWYNSKSKYEKLARSKKERSKE